MSAGARVDVERLSVAYTPQHDAVRDVSLTVRPGSIVVLLGPSGCGKTTLLRAIAGLERPRAGTITIGGNVVSGPQRWVAPERRQVGMVFQDPALFPHLSVIENVAFGLRRAGARDERARIARAALSLVRLDGFDDRRPATLSGGQQQRVALARSLAPRPAVLLLDEPLSALDATLRAEVRGELASILREVDVTSIFVTHDQQEAFALGDEIAVMRDGAVRQHGTPEELYARPVDPWVATFVGEANIVEGVAGGRTARTALGPVPLLEDHHGSVRVLIRPEDVELADAVDPSAWADAAASTDAAASPDAAASAAGHGDAAVVVRAEYFGHDVRYELRGPDGALLVARAHHGCRRAAGDRVLVRARVRATVAWPRGADGPPPGAAAAQPSGTSTPQ